MKDLVYKTRTREEHPLLSAKSWQIVDAIIDAMDDTKALPGADLADGWYIVDFKKLVEACHEELIDIQSTEIIQDGRAKDYGSLEFLKEEYYDHIVTAGEDNEPRVLMSVGSARAWLRWIEVISCKDFENLKKVKPYQDLITLREFATGCTGPTLKYCHEISGQMLDDMKTVAAMSDEHMEDYCIDYEDRETEIPPPLWLAPPRKLSEAERNLNNFKQGQARVVDLPDTH